MKKLLLGLSMLALAAGMVFAGARRAPPEQTGPREPAPAESRDSITIFENRKVMLALPGGFTVSTNQDPRGLATAHIEDWQGRVSIELTFLPDPDSRFGDPFAQKELMHRSYQEFLQGSVEGAMQFEELEPKIGRGTYCVFTDKKLVGRSELPPNEYLNATTGVKTWPGVVALFTVFSNGTSAKEYRSAMTLLRESVHERIAPLR